MKLDPSENVRGGHNWLGSPHWVRVVSVRLPFYLLIATVVVILPSWFHWGDRYRASALYWEAEAVLERALLVLGLIVLQGVVRLLSWSFNCIADRRWIPWLDRILEVSPNDRYLVTIGYAIMCLGPLLDLHLTDVDPSRASPTPGAPITAVGALILAAMAVRVVVYDGWVAWNEAGKAA